MAVPLRWLTRATGLLTRQLASDIAVHPGDRPLVWLSTRATGLWTGCRLGQAASRLGIGPGN